MTDIPDQKKRTKMTNKWSHLKRQLAQRQLLFYKAQIPIDSIYDYMSKTPPNEEILRIEKVIFNDREEKTSIVRNAIQLKVSHLRSPELGKILGTSDTTIRDILSGKKKHASYDVLDRIELYLAINFSFKPSLENKLTVQSYLNAEADEIITRINSISISLKDIPESIKRVIKQESYEQRTIGIDSYQYLPTPIDKLNHLRIELDQVTQDLEKKLGSFIPKPIDY